MLNQVVLVGRLYVTPSLNETEKGKKVSTIILAVPRSFKNTNGEYETDFIKCTLWSGVAESTVDYCKKGDIIGIKGRLSSRVVDDKNPFDYAMEVIAEKVTFLSNKKTEA